jgi:predicted ATPase
MDTPLEFDLTISNYRCFSREKPATIHFKPGFTSFVGVNNAGKSALLRFLFEFRQVFATIVTNWQSVVNWAGTHNVMPFDFPVGDRDMEELFCSENNGPLSIEITFPAGPQFEYLICNRILIRFDRRQKAGTFTLQWRDHPRTLSVQQVLTNYRFVDGGSGGQFDLSNVMAACKLLSQTAYFPSFRNAVNAGGGGKLFDMTVGQLFVEQWNAIKTSSANRVHNRAAVALTKDIARLLGFESLEINSTNEGDTLQLVIDGRTVRLDEVGSGIAQFILVLANAATINPAIILIDEPELNLHPSLQLDFLTTLAKYASYGTLFATHSLGLARSVSDQIYAVTRENSQSQVTRYEATPKLAEMLGLLSYSGYVMLGGESVLLVEGPTDVLVFQQFLRLYKKDLKVVILPLGGGELIKADSAVQLAEIRRICPNITAIIDSDRKSQDGEPKEKPSEFAKLCAGHGIHCHLTERAATENYLTDAAVKRAFGDNAKALQPWQPLKGSNSAWSKSQNWKAAKEMTLADLNATDLGPILAKL